MAETATVNFIAGGDSRQAARSARRIKAMLLSDRIDTAGLEHEGVISTAPLTYRLGAEGLVTLFRYGVAVIMCMSPQEEAEILRSLRPGLIRPVPVIEEEILPVEIAPDKEDQILPGGPMILRNMTPDRLIIIADALSKERRSRPRRAGGHLRVRASRTLCPRTC